MCIGSEYSDSCSGGVSRTLKSANTILAIPNAWSLGASGENLIASKARGTVAFSYRDNRLDANQQPISTENFAFFGQLDSVTSGAVLPSVAMLGFDVNGQLQSTVPDSARWTVSAGQPLAGFFQDGVGNTYLLSSSGQLVAWTVGSGLRIYSKP
ncbi:hypothetical protein AU476_12735 [Cupriavidus sp. UYMSc13B]|nr:hypothetical protein AU476_12735 [Cupriavidus sp. UYMSc13B]